MNDIILRCGGIGVAQLIVSQVLTRAIMPNCYFPEKKSYGYVSAEDGQVFYFDEDQKQFLFYKNLDESSDEFVLLVDLKIALFEVAA